MRADLALVGFGRVGRRFATLLDERRNRRLRDHDLETRIVGIATRRHGATFSQAGIDVEATLGCAAADLPLPRGNVRTSVTGAADLISP
jgi:homoserine dehydrogenase